MSRVSLGLDDNLLAYLRGVGLREDGDLQRLREDVEVLLSFARQEKWPRDQQQFLKGFLADYGIGGENEA